jgi:hypothetical protein
MAVLVSLGISLDGYVAGPNAGPENNLGDGADRLFRWMYDVEAWKERQNRSGGQPKPDNEIVEALYARVGAYVMGRNMFDEGEVGWPDPTPVPCPSSLSHTRLANPGSDRGNNVP